MADLLFVVLSCCFVGYIVAGVVICCLRVLRTKCQESGANMRNKTAKKPQNRERKTRSVASYCQKIRHSMEL